MVQAGLGPGAYSTAQVETHMPGDKQVSKPGDGGFAKKHGDPSIAKMVAQSLSNTDGMPTNSSVDQPTAHRAWSSSLIETSSLSKDLKQQAQEAVDDLNDVS